MIGRHRGLILFIKVWQLQQRYSREGYGREASRTDCLIATNVISGGAVISLLRYYCRNLAETGVIERVRGQVIRGSRCFV